MNDKLKSLALDYGVTVDEWPDHAKRDAVLAVYADDDGIYLSEACDELTDDEGECAALLKAFNEPSAVSREALLGKMLDKALMRRGLANVEAEVDANYDEWKRMDRIAGDEMAAESAAEFRRDMQAGPLVRSA